MKKFPLILFVAGCIVSLQSFSQNEIDALRYSQTFPTGTARFTSMGGAFGALGGDFSSLNLNPAGIGVFRKSEISFSPSIFSNSSTTKHYGSSGFGNKTNFNFGNAGIVVTFETGENNGWVSISIGFGYNRMNNFNTRLSIEGINNESSLLDIYKQQIEDVNADYQQMNQFGSALAWDAYLVDTIGGKYFTAIPNYGETQKKTINRSGSIGETFFSFGGNYNNKLYLGGTVGFTRIRFGEISTYSESTDSKDTTTNLNSFFLTENLSTNGSGINFKMGMIYRIHDAVRIGGAIHSPTYYDLSDKWDAKLDANFDDTVFNFQSAQGLNDYSIVTPFKAIGSIAFIFGKSGLLSFDYEFLDYSLARISGSGANNYSYSSENAQINDKYKSAGNIRIGTEWKINPFSLRAGYSNYGNPFSAGVGNKGTVNSFSAGLGIRDEGYFIDFGYVLSKGSENYYLYAPTLVKATNFEFLSQSFMVTLGVKF